MREAGVLEFGSRGAECWRSDASRIRHGETGRLAAPWGRGIVTAYSYDNNGALTNTVYSDGTPTISLAYNKKLKSGTMQKERRGIINLGVLLFWKVNNQKESYE